MLVLKRKRDQAIDIADGLISIDVVNIDRGVVTLGITCPRDILVLRKELIDPTGKIATHRHQVKTEIVLERQEGRAS